jgi:hypothetical protein
MNPKRPRKLRRFLLFGIGGLLAVCLLAAVISAGINAMQPTASTVVDRLSAASKAQVAEVIHLRQTLGDQVWPGWGEADLPVLLFNEQYAFLVGLPDPPDGWRLPLKAGISGAAWEQVPGDDFYGQPYYRQPVQDANHTIGNFIAQVGSSWAPAMGTQEWGRISFQRGFRNDLPPLVREVFPYGLAYRQLFGRSDVYLSGLEHEAFHAFQAATATQRLVEAEKTGTLVDRYPWDTAGVTSAWRSELSLLRQALQSSSDAEAKRLAGQFLSARQQRRQSTGLSAEFVDLERQREWLEGLAKYAELSLGRAAAVTPGYNPVPEMKADQGFNGWAGYRKFYDQQVGQMDKITSAGETWFYYSGMAQAVLLDRLMPGWKGPAFQPGVFLEDLLKEAVAK